MDSKPSEAERALKELSAELRLAYEPQDWGIVNADACRVEEFMDYYERHVGLGYSQRFELGGLILASANEAMALGDYALTGILREFLGHHASEFAAHLEYWRSLGDSEEFPLAKWLRNLRTEG